MEQLINAAFFRGEWSDGATSTPTRIDWQSLAHRPAPTTPPPTPLQSPPPPHTSTATSSATPVASVVAEEGGCLQGVRFYESAFGDPEKRHDLLPCGARTLYVNAETQQIALRGVNKFPEIEDIPTLCGDPAIRLRVTPEYIQRKLAGFVCVIASNGTGGLRVSSKHTLQGLHCGLATRLLHKRWEQTPADEEKRLSAFLQSHGAALVCECVDPENDAWHPVEEPQEHHGITLLCVVSAVSLRETTLPHLMPEASSISKIPIVPTYPLGWDSLQQELREAAGWGGERGGAAPLPLPVNSAALFDAKYGPGGRGGLGVQAPPCPALPHDPLSEGWVATFSLPSRDVLDVFRGRGVPGGGAGGVAEDGPRAFFRVKIKFLRYRLQRRARHSLESIGREGGAAAPRRLVSCWSSLPPHEKALVATCYDMHRREAAGGGEWWRVSGREMTRIFTGCRGEGGLAEAGDVECAARYFRSLHPPVPRAAHTLVISVGLPGSGKSTAFSSIASALLGVSDVACISRDALTSLLREEVGQRRDVSRMMHHRLRRLFETLFETSRSPTVVLLDGCHLTAGARLHFMSQFSRCVVVNVTAPAELCATRAASREDHLTLAGGTSAAQAVRLLAKRFAPHTHTGVPQEAAVLTIDTGGGAATAAADTASAARAIQEVHLRAGYTQAASPAMWETEALMRGSAFGADAASGAAATAALLRLCGARAPSATRAAGLAYVGVCERDPTAPPTTTTTAFSSALAWCAAAASAGWGLLGFGSQQHQHQQPWGPAISPLISDLAAMLESTQAAPGRAAPQQGGQPRLAAAVGGSLQWLRGASAKAIHKQKCLAEEVRRRAAREAGAGQQQQQQHGRRKRRRGGGAETASSPAGGATPHPTEMTFSDALLQHYRLGGWMAPGGGGGGGSGGLHCTLVYLGGALPHSDAEAGAAERLLDGEVPLGGALCDIECGRLLCDGKAMCLAVTKLAPRGEGVSGLLPAAPEGAHITLGTAEGVPPKHALALMQSVARWGVENAESAAERKRCRAGGAATEGGGEEDDEEEEEEEDLSGSDGGGDAAHGRRVRRRVGVVAEDGGGGGGGGASRKQSKKGHRMHNFADLEIEPPLRLAGYVTYVPL